MDYFHYCLKLLDSINLPVIAAGGIADGRGIVAAMMLGAEGVQLGTAFLKCPEASVHPLWKKALDDSKSRETRITVHLLVDQQEV